MHNGGLRPFQPVVYLTQLMKDQIEWRGHRLQDLFHFPTLSKCLGEDDLLALLQLNSNEDNKPNYLLYHHPLGTETLMSVWLKTSNNEDTDYQAREVLKNLVNKLKLPDQKSALEKALASELTKEQLEKTEHMKGFEIIHDERLICVILKQNEHNLLNRKEVKDLAQSIVTDVVKTYNLYYHYGYTANSPWFTTYIKNL